MHVSRGRGRKDSGQNLGQNSAAPMVPGTRYLGGIRGAEGETEAGPAVLPGLAGKASPGVSRGGRTAGSRHSWPLT